MNPACQLCRGACCETIVVAPPANDDGRWLRFHGTPLADGRLELATPCSMLKPCGTCAIHTLRPEACRAFPVGGADCRATVLRRRSALAQQILALFPT